MLTGYAFSCVTDADYNVPLNPGSGPVFLQGLLCSGYEDEIFDCDK